MSTVADPTGQKFHKAWGTRLQSLRNIPPVLRIIWDSSPAVVTWGLILRAISALSPLALLAVARLIIDAVVVHISHDTPLRTDFWWLVGLEFGLACLASVLNRIVDYCDTLLADKFIRHISVRIMHHASRLDLASYEDPLFHDKLERARVQATDRLGMVQQLGRLVAASHHHRDVGCQHPVIFSLAVAGVDCLRDSRIPGRKPLCVSRLCAGLPADARQTPDRLSAISGGQQGQRERTESFLA